MSKISNPIKKKTALIIGAGPAGLTAALTLLESTDIHPIIVEQSAMIGGIAKTINHNGNRIDIGGHRFFSKEKKIVDLWTKILPVQGHPSYDDLRLNRFSSMASGGPNPEKVDEVFLIRQRVSRIYYLRHFFDYPLSLKWQTIKNLGLLRTFKAGFGYLISTVYKRKEKTLQDFMINRFSKPLYHMFFEDYTYKVWGVKPADLAPEWGAQRIKGLSLGKAIISTLIKPFKRDNKTVETSLIEQFNYPKFGPGQLYEQMGKMIVDLGGEILFDYHVDKIELKNNHIYNVEMKTSSQTISYQPDYVFSSMPIKDFVEAIGLNEDNKQAYKIAANLQYRDFITVGLLVDKLKITNTTKIKTLNNIVPDCWIYIQEREVKLGRLQIFNNWSPYMVKDPDNTVWIGLEYFANEGDQLWTMTDKQLIDMAVKELITIGIIEQQPILDCVRINVKKAYPAYHGAYGQFNVVKDYLQSIDNLYCIGRNGQHRYNNMDHSMLTAMVAVEAIKSNSSLLKKQIWDVNTEQTYHEKK